MLDSQNLENTAEISRSRIRSYLEDHPELIDDTEKAELPIEDKEDFSKRMADGLKESLGNYLAAEMPKQRTEEGAHHAPVLINEVRLDDKIPIDMKVYKLARYKEDGGREKVCDQLFIGLERAGEWLGEFVIRDYGNEFRFNHRKLDPKYRGGGIPDIVLRSFEEFLKEYKKQKPTIKPDIHVMAGQLDVISWFIKNGYEFTKEDFPNPYTGKIYDFDEIMSSLEQGGDNAKFAMTPGEYLYVFPTDFQGPHMLPGGTKADNMDMDNSALVHLEKKVETNEDSSEELKHMEDQIKKKVEDTIG